MWNERENDEEEAAAEEQVEDKLKCDYQTRFTVLYLCFGTIARDISLMPRLALALPSLSLFPRDRFSFGLFWLLERFCLLWFRLGRR